MSCICTATRSGGSGASATTSTQVVTLTSGLTTTVAGFSLDAAGNLASDTRLAFAYDAQGRLAQLTARQGPNLFDEAAQVTYLHNALGQRVFKSEPRLGNTAPNEAVLVAEFVWSWICPGSTDVHTRKLRVKYPRS
jgi:YD repeat-containing protein